jgi:hypothetical protein
MVPTNVEANNRHLPSDCITDKVDRDRTPLGDRLCEETSFSHLAGYFGFQKVMDGSLFEKRRLDAQLATLNQTTSRRFYWTMVLANMLE